MEKLILNRKTHVCYLAVDYNGDAHTYDEMPHRFERPGYHGTEDKEWLGKGASLVGSKILGYDSIPEELRGMTWTDEPKRIAVEMTTYITDMFQSDGLAE